MTAEGFRHSFKGNTYHLGLAVYSCGEERCVPGHSWGPAVRDHFLIHYIVSGSGTFSTGGTSYRLHAREAFLLKPNVVASYQADRKDPWSYCWVGFHGSDVPHLLRQAGLMDREPVFDCGEENDFEELLRGIVAVSGNGDSAEARMESRLLWFLAALMDRFGQKEGHSGDAGYLYVQKAIRFIDHHYSMPIGIGQIADSAGVSRSHLYRLFMEHINLPPNEYLTRYRLQKAVGFLREGGLSVGEAAYSTGFSDPLYFSRVFKKHMGAPPSAFLKAGGTRNG